MKKPRKTRIDKAIEAVEAEIVALRERFEQERLVKEQVIDALRAQQQPRPVPRAVKAS